MTAKKDGDEKRVENFLGEQPQSGIRTTNPNVMIDSVANIITSKSRFSSDEKNLFVRVLLDISRRHGKKSRLIKFLSIIFGGRKDVEKTSDTIKLKDLLQILTSQEFYVTTKGESQEKYIKKLLDHLVRYIPDDYNFLLQNFPLDNLAKEDHYETGLVAKLIVQRLTGESSQSQQPDSGGSINVGDIQIRGDVSGNIVVGSSSISNRLAGDETTDAPPPDISKKKKKKNKK